MRAGSGVAGKRQHWQVKALHHLRTQDFAEVGVGQQFQPALGFARQFCLCLGAALCACAVVQRLQEEGRGGQAGVHHLLEGGDTRFFHERVGVFPGRHEHEAPFVLFVMLAEDGFQRLACCFLSGGVAIEGEIDFLRALFQLADMAVANGGAEGGNGVFHAVLPQFDNVHIAFGDEQGTFARLHGLVQAVQLKALVKPGCLRRVQVFRLRFTHCPRTKGDDFAFDVVDGEDDALTKPVVMVVVFDADQSHILQQLQRVFAAKVGKQGVAGRGIAEQEGINGCFF